MRPYKKKHYTGKSVHKFNGEALEARLATILGNKNFDAFTERVIKLHKNPRYKEESLKMAEDYCNCVGLKNFYNLAGFVKEETGRDCEIRIFKKADTRPDIIRKYLQEYLDTNIAKDALVFIEFYDMENNRLQKINYLKWGKERSISGKDFPQENGALKLYIQEDESYYALHIDMIKGKKEVIGEINPIVYVDYNIIIKPLDQLQILR